MTLTPFLSGMRKFGCNSISSRKTRESIDFEIDLSISFL